MGKINRGPAIMSWTLLLNLMKINSIDLYLYLTFNGGNLDF